MLRRTVAVHPSAELYGSDRMFLESVVALPGAVLAVVPVDGPLVSNLVARGVSHEIVDFPVLRRVALRSPADVLLYLLRFAAAVPRLAKWLRAQDADLLYVSTVIAPVWLYAGRLAGLRVMCHVHESEPDMSRLTSRLLLWPLRRIERVLCNSVDSRQWIVASVSAAAARRTTVVANGVAQPVGVDGSAEGGPVSGRLVVVGRLHQRKGQDVAVRALALLRGEGRDVSLSLVGDCYPGYEPFVEELRELVLQERLQSHVTFEGFQPRAAGYLASAAVVLVPSRVEPFGNVAVEALLLGRPLVASAVGGLHEIVEDGVTGRLVPPNDPVAVAAAVTELLDDPRRAADLAAAGRASARARFSVEGYGARLRLAVLGQAGGASGASP